MAVVILEGILSRCSCLVTGCDQFRFSRSLGFRRCSERHILNLHLIRREVVEHLLLGVGRPVNQIIHTRQCELVLVDPDLRVPDRRFPLDPERLLLRVVLHGADEAGVELGGRSHGVLIEYG